MVFVPLTRTFGNELAVTTVTAEVLLSVKVPVAGIAPFWKVSRPLFKVVPPVYGLTPLTVVLPVRFSAPLLMTPENVRVLRVVLLTSNVPLIAMDEEIVSPRLVGNSTSVAGAPELSNVRDPPLGAIVKLPLPEPMFSEPMVMGWFKLMVWFPEMAELTTARI